MYGASLVQVWCNKFGASKHWRQCSLSRFFVSLAYSQAYSSPRLSPHLNLYLISVIRHTSYYGMNIIIIVTFFWCGILSSLAFTSWWCVNSPSCTCTPHTCKLVTLCILHTLHSLTHSSNSRVTSFSWTCTPARKTLKFRWTDRRPWP